MDIKKLKKMLMDQSDDGDEGGMDGMHKDAKMAVLQNLKKDAEGAMSGKLDKMGMKKVSVMSDSKEGVEKGLDKAKELVEGSPEEEASESPDEEAMEGAADMGPAGEVPSMMSKEHMMAMSPEEIDHHIMMLQQLKAMKHGG